jgi:hypothetical protein
MLRKIIGNLNVTTKLTLSFGIMLALTIAVSYEGIHASQKLNDSTKLLLTQDLAGISAIKEAGIFQVNYTRALRDEVLAIGDKATVQDNKDLISELDALGRRVDRSSADRPRRCGQSGQDH